MGSRYQQYGSDRSDISERVVSLNRVAKVVKGGRKFSFSALIVVGDGNGRVGAGMGKAREVPEAIRKGVEIAKRNMINVPMVGTTIPHEVRHKWGAAKIMLKPAAPGTGVISGGAMRAVIELSGIKDILTKSMGTNNPINTVRATMEALQSMRTAQEIAELRGKTVEEIVGRKLAAAYRSAAQKGTIDVLGGDGGPAPAVAAEPGAAAAEPDAKPRRATRPKAEAPAVEEPKAAAPAVEEPKAAAPAVEAPEAAAPAVEEAKAETPAVEEPKAKAPSVEKPKATEPEPEAPPREDPVSEP